MEANLAQAALTAAMLVIFGGFLFWAIRTGQFRNVEDANRRLFTDRSNESPEEGNR